MIWLMLPRDRHFQESSAMSIFAIVSPVLSSSTHSNGEAVETASDFILGGSKITADGDCNMKLKDAYSLEEKLWPT